MMAALAFAGDRGPAFRDMLKVVNLLHLGARPEKYQATEYAPKLNDKAEAAANFNTATGLE